MLLPKPGRHHSVLAKSTLKSPRLPWWLQPTGGGGLSLLRGLQGSPGLMYLWPISAPPPPPLALVPELPFSSNSASPSGIYSFDIFLERNRIFLNLHFSELKGVLLFLVALCSSLP